mgnify:CR=1 FL=1
MKSQAKKWIIKGLILSVFLLFFLILSTFILHTNPFILTAEAAAPTAGLVGYWNFDEGSGAVANDLSRRSLSEGGSSGNGNNGTINPVIFPQSGTYIIG